MNRADLDTFEKLAGQLSSVYEELSLLSKKSPADAVNKFKLNFVNQLLTLSNKFLGERYRPFDGFQAFDADDLPQNSDVVFILGQYIECFEKLRSDNLVIQHGTWHWKIDDKKSKDGATFIRSSKPKRFTE